MDEIGRERRAGVAFEQLAAIFLQRRQPLLSDRVAQVRAKRLRFGDRVGGGVVGRSEVGRLFGEPRVGGIFEVRAQRFQGVKVVPGRRPRGSARLVALQQVGQGVVQRVQLGDQRPGGEQLAVHGLPALPDPLAQPLAVLSRQPELRTLRLGQCLGQGRAAVELLDGLGAFEQVADQAPEVLQAALVEPAQPIVALDVHAQPLNLPDCLVELPEGRQVGDPRKRLGRGFRGRRRARQALGLALQLHQRRVEHDRLGRGRQERGRTVVQIGQPGRRQQPGAERAVVGDREGVQERHGILALEAGLVARGGARLLLHRHHHAVERGAQPLAVLTQAVRRGEQADPGQQHGREAGQLQAALRPVARQEGRTRGLRQSALREQPVRQQIVDERGRRGGTGGAVAVRRRLPLRRAGQIQPAQHERLVIDARLQQAVDKARHAASSCRSAWGKRNRSPTSGSPSASAITRRRVRPRSWRTCAKASAIQSAP